MENRLEIFANSILSKGVYTVDDVLNMDFSQLNVIICGFPASGKSEIFDKLNRTEHKCFKSDDYIEYGYKDSLYRIIDDIKAQDRFIIFEGIQGYRLIRKGLEWIENDTEPSFLIRLFPCVVLDIHTTPENIERIYQFQRNPEKLKRLPGTIKGIANTRKEVLSMFRQYDFIHWIDVFNNYQ